MPQFYYRTTMQLIIFTYDFEEPGAKQCVLLRGVGVTPAYYTRPCSAFVIFRSIYVPQDLLLFANIPTKCNA